MTASVQLKKIVGRESQWACRQDELIGGKPPAVKVTMTLTLTLTLTLSSYQMCSKLMETVGKCMKNR
jgi:hypothetical protein